MQAASLQTAEVHIGRRYITIMMNKNKSLKPQKKQLEESGIFKKPIVTDILKAEPFL